MGRACELMYGVLMYLSAALSVSFHRRHTAAASFEQETPLCLAHSSSTSLVRLWQICRCCFCALAQFVSAARAMLLLVLSQRSFLGRQPMLPQPCMTQFPARAAVLQHGGHLGLALYLCVREQPLRHGHSGAAGFEICSILHTRGLCAW